MENLARAHKQELESDHEPALPIGANDNEKLARTITHPEAANDNEVAQPISTIYPEVANDNAPVITPEDAAQIEVFKERLRVHATQGAEQPLPEQVVEVPQIPSPENVPVAAEVQPGSSEAAAGESAPETAQASGGAEREDGGGASGGSRRTPDLRIVGGGKGDEKKKRKFGWIGKVLAFPFKAALWLGGLALMLSLSAIRKISNYGLTKAGFPDKGKGGGTKS